MNVYIDLWYMVCSYVFVMIDFEKTMAMYIIIRNHYLLAVVSSSLLVHNVT